MLFCGFRYIYTYCLPELKPAFAGSRSQITHPSYLHRTLSLFTVLAEAFSHRNLKISFLVNESHMLYVFYVFSIPLPFPRKPAESSQMLCTSVFPEYNPLCFSSSYHCLFHSLLLCAAFCLAALPYFAGGWLVGCVGLLLEFQPLLFPLRYTHNPPVFCLYRNSNYAVFPKTK